jgi:hypothetical protein
LKKIALFIALSILLLYIADILYTYLLRRDPANKAAWAMQHPAKNLDHLFLGNSRSLALARTGEWADSSNKKMYNLGMDGSNLMQQYFLLYHFYKAGNKTNYIHLQLDPWGLQLKPSNYFRTWTFLPFINDDTIQQNLKAVYGKRTYLWRYVPFYRYAEFNARLGMVSALNLFNPVAKKVYNSTGDLQAVSEKVGNLNKIRNKEVSRIKSLPINLAYIERMISLATQHGSKVHIYTAPVVTQYYSLYSNTDSVIQQQILPLCQKYHCTYDNYSIQPWSSDTTYFYDHHHMNKKGLKLYSKLWLDYISKCEALVNP